MEKCTSCGGEVEVISHRCSQCGLVQIASPANMPAHPLAWVTSAEANSPCPRCEHLMPIGAHFCGNCGYEMPVDTHFCENCGHFMPAGARFCGNCGYGLHEQWPWQILHQRLLVVKRASPPMRAIIYIAFGQLILVALLLLTKNIPQTLVNSGVLDNLGGNYVVPLPLFLVLILSLALGYWFTLLGALRARWFVGLPLIAAIIYVLAYVPFSEIVNGVRFWEYWGQLGILALLASWKLWITGRQWSTVAAHKKASTNTLQPATPIQETKSELLRGREFLGVLVLLLLYYGLELMIWVSAIPNHQAKAELSQLLTDMGTQVVTLTTLLIVVLLLGSTDILEWGQMTAQSVVRVVKRVRTPWALWGITMLVALATIGKVLSVQSNGIWLALLVACALAIGIWGLLRLISLPAGWSDNLRTPMVQIGAILIYCYLTVISQVTDTWAASLGLPQEYFSPLFILIVLPIGLATLTVCLFVLLRGRLHGEKQQVLWLFAVLVLLLLVVATIPQFLTVIGLSALFPLQHLPDGLQLLAGLSVLIWGINLVARAQLTGKNEQLANALLLLIGLQTVFWVQDLLNTISSLQGTFWLAMLFLATNLWSLITAGEQLELTAKPSERESRSLKTSVSVYQREGIILLYVGYTLVANVLLLYLGSLQVVGHPTNLPDYLTQDVYSPLGLSVLGSLVVIMAFFSRMQTISPQMMRQTSAPVQPVRHISARTLSWSILGSGTLITSLVLAFALISALPQLLPVYSTPVPGPDCNPKGATWTLTQNNSSSTRCLKSGLQVEAASPFVANINFMPPSRVISQNYSVSVQVNLSQVTNACVGFLTHTTNKGEYASELCISGIWFIARISVGHPLTTLVTGKTSRTAVFTLGVVVSGTYQRLVLNGRTLGTTSDKTFTQGGFSLLFQNNKPAPAIAFFSNFCFSPLPTSTTKHTSIFSPECAYN